MLQKKLRQLAVETLRPDNSVFLALTLSDARTLSHSYQLPLLDIEIAALEQDIVPLRFSRNMKTFSSQDQLKLLQSHVAVIGLGGLGGIVTDILARTGIGHLTVVDGDVFDETNMNRQLLATTSSLGQTKSSVAAERIAQINPAVNIRPIQEFLTEENAQTILAGVDLVSDCLDTIDSRFTLGTWCSKLHIPLVSAAVAATSGQATSIFPEDPGFKQIYGATKRNSARGMEATLGTLAYAAYHMASVQSAEVIAILLGQPGELRNRLYLAEIAEHTAEIMDF